MSTAKFDYWLNSDNVLQSTILNVYSTTSTTQQSTSQRGTSSTNYGQYWYDCSGVTLTVTPVSTTSKFFIFGKLCISTANGGTNSYNMHCRLLRNSTEIGSGLSQASAGGDSVEPWNAMIQARQWTSAAPMQCPYSFIDAPATTSSITYKMQFLQSYDNYPVQLNRSQETGWQSGDTSSITIMEIQA